MMSPLFGAVFLWLSTVILWWSGWKTELAGRIPSRAVSLFLAVWPAAVGFNWTATPALTLNGAWIWTLAIMFVLAMRTEPSGRWLAVSAGVLFGAIFLLMYRLSFFPGGLATYLTPWGAALLIGGLAALLLHDAVSQLLAVTTALFLSEAVAAAAFSGSEEAVLAKSLQWMESWWIAVVFARALTAIASFEWQKGRQRL